MALRHLRPLAEQGDSDSQRKLDWMYRFGPGATQHYKENAKWFHMAAEQCLAVFWIA